MNEYEAKQEAKRERYEQLALKWEKESDRRYQASHDAVANIPLGQPILVGHHSEGAHRAALKRSWDNMGKSIEADKTAEYYRQKAANVGKGGISSDDPDAIQKLQEKLTGLKANQELMKAANKIIRNSKTNTDYKVAGMVELGLTQSQANELLEGDFCGRVGFASYALQNNNANIKRVEQRIKQLEARQGQHTQEKQVGEIKIVDNVEANRLQIFFPGKPDADTRKTLKSYGFRWAPSNGCWQAYRNNRAQWALEQLGLK